jgi:protein gp37
MTMALNSKHTLCSAQRLAERYYNFEPTWIEENFQKDFPKKPSMIFIDSMSDICWWRPNWLNYVLIKMNQHPEHIYIALTKRPDLTKILLNDLHQTTPVKFWIGVSASTQIDIEIKIPQLLEIQAAKHFISIEPIQGAITLEKYLQNLDWIIVGQETGNSKTKIKAKKEWIDNLRAECFFNEIFEKNNLLPIMKNLIQEWLE